jgi:glycosyltransferase involved in cell wall biosynthesis
MKVWLLLSRWEHGGLERVQLNIAKAMAAREIDVSIVAGKFPVTVRQELPATVPMLELAKAGPRRFPRALLRALFHERPDVVFTTSNDVACMTLLFRLLFFRKLRVIVTQHQSLSAPRQHTVGLTRVKLKLIRAGMKWLLGSAEKVVTVSEGVAQDLKQDLSLPDLPVSVIHNPIVALDFEERMHLAPAWPWPNRNVSTIIFVGRLSTEKRLDLLLDSFHSLVQRVPARLLIVGTGPLQPEIETRIQRDGLGSQCKLVGFTDNPLPLILASDVLVLQSDYEGFGNVLVEAMACGTQAISTDCHYGPAEILCNGRFGQLVPTGDCVALEIALRKSLTGEFHVPADELKERAGHFSVDKATERYIALLHTKPV